MPRGLARLVWPCSVPAFVVLLAATPALAQFGLPSISRAARMFNDATRGAHPGVPHGRSLVAFKPRFER